jgi:hypothetical protein
MGGRILIGVVDLATLISHDRREEDPMEKARWFQTLTIKERADLLCAFTDLVLEINPKVMEHKNAQPVAGRIRVLSKA